jgi:DNA-binding transcriptional regulator YdaS (Cro superfamily)
MDIAEIIKRAGGVSRLARILSLHHSTVLGWADVPPKHVPAIASLLEVERHEIRPDLWEKPKRPSVEAA